MNKNISTTAGVNNPANQVKATTSAKTHKPRSITATKKRLLQALKDSLGVVSSACEAVGISRSDYEFYYREDEDFRTAVNATTELTLDYVEEALLKLIEAGNVTATLFYLKTKGKARGYTERGDGNSDNKSTLTAVLEELRALYHRELAEEGKGAEDKNSVGTLKYTLRSDAGEGQEYHKNAGGYDTPRAAYSPPVEHSESSARHSIDKLFNLHENTYRS